VTGFDALKGGDFDLGNKECVGRPKEG